jgi:hypothetical protein
MTLSSGVGWPTSDDVLDPRSRHNRHVTRPEDVEPVGGWPRETLYEAVRLADGEGGVVVIDYGRSELYVADGSGLDYEPPRRLGFVAPPVLHVAAPRRFESRTGTTTPADPVSVSPRFDILVPAFDWEQLDEDDALPPVARRASRSATGAGTGSSG